MEESEAVEPISRKQMGELKREADEVGRDFDMVPAKAIFSRKAGSGRHKCRGVACGNYVGKTTTESTYASGAGSCEVRFLLKTAAIQAWSVSTLDVKTAFLNAPVDDSVDRGAGHCGTTSHIQRCEGPSDTLKKCGLVPKRHCTDWSHRRRIGYFTGTADFEMFDGSRREWTSGWRRHSRMTCG